MGSVTVTRFLPRGAALTDIGFVLVLGTVSMYGFRDTFHGWTYLVAGVGGLLLGAAMAWLASVLRQPVIVLALFVIAAFFLLGGAVAGPDSAVAALPLPDTLVSLADQSVHGWKDLLTTLPPVDGGPLLALPYLLGLIAGAGALTLALRLRSAYLPVLASLALLAAVILLGVQNVSHVVIIGIVSAVLAVTWAILRAHRLATTVTIGTRSRSRIATAAALCLVATGAALLMGPRLPGLKDERVVLRTWVEPPFDVGQYPSPLASFRKNTTGYAGPLHLRMYDEKLLTVEGVKPGTLVRFAGLDNYNGIVWGAANDSGTEPGNRDTFQKVGSVINNPVSGKPVTAKITVEKGYSGVWLPSIGALEGINFGDGLDDQSEDFRYNLATDTGVVPGGIQPGDTYSIESVLPPSKLDKDVQPWSGALPGAEAGSRFQALAAQWAGEGESPLARVLAVADHLRAEGKYTNGESGFEQFRAGHSLSRLTEFVAADHQLAGDDEQYAAMMALLANQLGVPARVVMGAAVPDDGVIKGRDVHAWVEMRAADGSWRTLPTKDFLGTDKPDQENPQEKQLVAGKVIPPPAPIRPPSTAGDPVQDGLNRIDQHHDSDFQIPGFVIGFLKYVVLPLALLAAIFGLIVGLKRRRRRLRRTRGTPARRLSLAWHDLLDHARDHGHSVTGRSTRREQAVQTGLAGFAPLARGADAHIFGRTEPTDSDAESYWAQVDTMRSEMVEPLSRFARLKGAVNLASFRRMEGTRG